MGTGHGQDNRPGKSWRILIIQLQTEQVITGSLPRPKLRPWVRIDELQPRERGGGEGCSSVQLSAL